MTAISERHSRSRYVSDIEPVSYLLNFIERLWARSCEQSSRLMVSLAHRANLEPLNGEKRQSSLP